MSKIILIYSDLDSLYEYFYNDAKKEKSLLPIPKERECTVRAIDLSFVIENKMPGFPGDPDAEIRDLSTVAEAGCAMKSIFITTHIGTHIDAPAHMIEGGKTLDDFPLEKFFGSAVVLDVRDQAGGEISSERLGGAEDLPGVDFLLLYSGWDEKFGTDGFFRDFPVLSEEAARAIGRSKIKGVGIDVLSFDPVDSPTFPIHKILLATETLLIENLRGLGRLPFNRPFQFAAMPLPVKKADGAPARAAAFLDER